jgi:hypothetical protein
MKTPIIVAQCPAGYNSEQKQELENLIETALQTNGIIVVPKGVDIFVLPHTSNN